MAKRVDDLFLAIANFPALTAAALVAARGKRRKPGVAAFLARLESNVLRLERALLAGSWQPGEYTLIEVNDPKPRRVSAAPFRDRVVHHAICAVVEPIFERGFIHDSYANRVGKGTHRAIDRYEHYRDCHAHVLRCDIYRFFPSIDHDILKHDLRRRGLPIGNLTSQFFANVYLDGFDHWVKEVLRAPYVRYVDDFALFHDDPAVLAEWQGRIVRYFEQRRLRLHPRKTRIQPCAEPAEFLGMVLCKPGLRRLPEANVRRFRNRLQGLRDRWRAGTVSRDEVQQRVQAWQAHAAHANTWRLRHAIFRDGWFDPAWSDGSSVAEA